MTRAAERACRAFAPGTDSSEELIAWIKHPERVRPGIAMPTWDGVIGEEEYAPLAAYIRSLARDHPPGGGGSYPPP